MGETIPGGHYNQLNFMIMKVKIIFAQSTDEVMFDKLQDFTEQLCNYLQNARNGRQFVAAEVCPF